MSVKIKSALHGIISILGNILAIGLVPDPYKVYVVLAFNLIQVILAFFDPTYAVSLLGKNAPPVPPQS